jgi:hypothetical protein
MYLPGIYGPKNSGGRKLMIRLRTVRKTTTLKIVQVDPRYQHHGACTKSRQLRQGLSEYTRSPGSALKNRVYLEAMRIAVVSSHMSNNRQIRAERVSGMYSPQKFGFLLSSIASWSGW